MKLDIIPVIDLRHGLVVRAVMGRRELYRPIETPLSRTADAEDVVLGLLALHHFKALYIADLDAIEGTGDNTSVVTRLQKRFAHLDIWTDNGIAASLCDPSVARRGSRHPRARQRIASERRRGAKLQG